MALHTLPLPLWVAD